MKWLSALPIYILFIFTSNTAASQFYYPVTPNNYINNSISSQNTGTDCIDNNGNLFQVMVTDCDAAGVASSRVLAWDDGAGNTGLIPLPTYYTGAQGLAQYESDPDVCLVKNGSDIIVYVVQIGGQTTYNKSRIVIDATKWNGTGFQSFSSANSTFLSPLNNFYESWPNIDANSAGEIVVTWSEFQSSNGKIMAANLQYSGSAPYYSVLATSTCISNYAFAALSQSGEYFLDNFVTPDVCINDSHIVTFAMSNITALSPNTNANAINLISYQASFSSISTGTTLNCGGSSGPECSFMMRPRIACVEKPSYPNDFAIVYECKPPKCRTQISWLYGFLYHDGTGYLSFPGTSNSTHIPWGTFYYPVIAASGDYYDIVYEFLDINNFINTTTLLQIVSFKLNYDGSGPLHNEFSVVSSVTDKNCSFPSVAGSNSLGKFCYLFCLDNYSGGANSALTYKNSNASNLILRSSVIPENTRQQRINDMELSIFPNPTTDYITIQSQKSLKNLKTILDITDVNGKWIRRISNAGFSTQIDISTLPSGTYFVRLQVPGAKQIVKSFIKL